MTTSASEKLKNFQVDVKQEERNAAKENIKTLKLSLWVMLGSAIWWACHITNGLGWLIQLSGWKDEILLAGDVINIFVFLAAFFFAYHSAKQVKTGS